MYSYQLKTVIDPLHPVQCIGVIECGPVQLQNFGLEADWRRKLKYRYTTLCIYFDSSSESHSESVYWMWRLIRIILITLINTDIYVKTKENLDCLTDTRTIIQSQTVV